MNKTVIAPLVALALMVIGGLFHIDFTEDQKTAITEVVALFATAAVAAYGVYKNHFNKPPKQ